MNLCYLGSGELAPSFTCYCKKFSVIFINDAICVFKKIKVINMHIFFACEVKKYQKYLSYQLQLMPSSYYYKNFALEHIKLDEFLTFLTSASNYFELNHFGSQSSNDFVLTQNTVNTNYTRSK